MREKYFKDFLHSADKKRGHADFSNTPVGPVAKRSSEALFFFLENEII